MRNTIKKILKENDFDWANNVEPISAEKIKSEIEHIADYGISNHQISIIAKKAYKLGLLGRGLDIFVGILEDISESSFEDGKQVGWEEGHIEGWREKKYECEEEEEEIRQEGYDVGYDVGYDEGYEAGSQTEKEEMEQYHQEQMEKEANLIYNQAFEDGRAYEAELDTEDYERRQSGFNPADYDGDYEN